MATVTNLHEYKYSKERIQSLESENNRLIDDNQKVRSQVTQIKEWFNEESAPTVNREHYRCPVCGTTWKDTVESPEHHRNYCWILGFIEIACPILAKYGSDK